MRYLCEIGQPPWTRADMETQLEVFADLYANRPLKDNSGGMKSPHLFLAYFALKTLQPEAVIESGVWRGQGTWFFERACPDAEIFCIDPVLERIQYKSKRAQYFKTDFSLHDWSRLPPEKTVLFFDDHQNAYQRLALAKWMGFKHMLFEDNYPSGMGDCYSLKAAWEGGGFNASLLHPAKFSANTLKQKLRKLLGRSTKPFFTADNVPSNDFHAEYMKKNLDVYQEMPPVFKTENTRWNIPWTDDNFPTPEPLLTEPEKNFQRIYLKEAQTYTWMCYVRLK